MEPSDQPFDTLVNGTAMRMNYSGIDSIAPLRRSSIRSQFPDSWKFRSGGKVSAQNPATEKPATKPMDISVGLLQEDELNEADQSFDLPLAPLLVFLSQRLFIREPITFTLDGRPTAAAFAARSEGKLLGTNFGTNWGSVGFFGPLTIHPDYWDRGVGKRLMEPIMECFARWHTRHSALFTFAQSQKHVGLYQQFGFLPRYLTAIMARPVKPD